MPSTHIQARLMRNDLNRPRETDALDIYDALIREKWSDREIVREALIAYGTMAGQGWQPVHGIGAETVHETTFRMLQQILGLLQQLQVSGVAITPEQGQIITDVYAGAEKLIGRAQFFDLGDE